MIRNLYFSPGWHFLHPIYNSLRHNALPLFHRCRNANNMSSLKYGVYTSCTWVWHFALRVAESFAKVHDTGLWPRWKVYCRIINKLLSKHLKTCTDDYFLNEEIFFNSGYICRIYPWDNQYIWYLTLRIDKFHSKMIVHLSLRRKSFAFDLNQKTFWHHLPTGYLLEYFAPIVTR